MTTDILFIVTIQIKVSMYKTKVNYLAVEIFKNIFLKLHSYPTYIIKIYVYMIIIKCKKKLHKYILICNGKKTKWNVMNLFLSSANGYQVDWPLKEASKGLASATGGKVTTHRIPHIALFPQGEIISFQGAG